MAFSWEQIALTSASGLAGAAITGLLGFGALVYQMREKERQQRRRELREIWKELYEAGQKYWKFGSNFEFKWKSGKVESFDDSRRLERLEYVSKVRGLGLALVHALDLGEEARKTIIGYYNNLDKQQEFLDLLEEIHREHLEI